MTAPALERPFTPQDALVALFAPALAGAAMALPLLHESPLRFVGHAFAIPAVFLGVSALMLPALYVALTLTGERSTVQGLAGDVARSLRDGGIVFLGLTPAMLFLNATATDAHAPSFLAYAVTALVAVLGIRVLQKRLFESVPAPAGADARWVARAVFLVWAAIAGGIGERLVSAALSA